MGRLRSATGLHLSSRYGRCLNRTALKPPALHSLHFILIDNPVCFFAQYVIMSSCSIACVSYDFVRAAFQNVNDLSQFKCIATPGNKRRCGGDLDPDQKKNANLLLGKEKTDLTLDDVRNIYTCLLCSAHQGTYWHKNKVEARWIIEFPHLDFSPARSPSPYSLHGKRHSQDRRRSSNLTPSSSSSIPTLTTWASEPAAARPSRLRLSLPRRASTAGSPAAASLHGMEGSDGVQQDDFDSARDRDDSPSAGRGRRSVNHSRANGVASPVGEYTDVTPPAPGPEPAVGMLQENVTHRPRSASRGSSSNETSASVDTGPFYPGEASTWAPWTLRSAVLKKLWGEPIPNAKSIGSIYAVQVKGQRYVKIGITRIQVRKRLNDIAKSHGQALEVENAFFQDVPVLQLERLENVVHADLAYFQRDLRVVHGQNQRTSRELIRTHHEYFEIDLDTAMRTIRLWIQIMDSIGAEPGNEIGSTIIKAVQNSHALNGDTCSPKDHERRLGDWAEAFRLNKGGLRKIQHTMTFPWLVGAMLVVLFLQMVNMPPLMAYIAVVLLGIAWMQERVFWPANVAK